MVTVKKLTISEKHLRVQSVQNHVSLSTVTVTFTKNAKNNR